MKTRTININTITTREAAGGNGWEFDALACPWETVDDIGGGVFEKIARGALTPSAQGVKLRLEHSETIGKIIACSDDADGLYITARISDTTAGRDARALLNDGALTGLSVGFIPTLEPDIERQDGKTIFTQRAGELLEVSLVSFPAYKDTKVTEIRQQTERGNIMTDSTASAVDYAAQFDLLERSITALGDKVEALTVSDNKQSTLQQYRNFGAYVKAIVAGDETANRDYEGAIMADDGTLKPAWVARTLKKMSEKQRVTNLFKHTYSLPAKGNTIEYPIFGTDTVKVGRQAKEADPLPYGKITLDTATAPIKTYGGYSEVTRQQIERGSELYLSTLFERQAMHYAQAIETETRELLTTQLTANTENSKLTTVKAFNALTVDDLITILIDAAALFDETDTNLDGIAVGADVFKYLATLDEDRKALKFVSASAGDGNQGTVNISALEARLGALPVHIIPNTGVLAFYSSDAIEIHESAGAPLRLQDENIINLSKAFSVYGYAAHFAPDPSALVPVKFGA